MRDAIEIFEFADHSHEWFAWVRGALHRVDAALRWAGAAFVVEGLRRAG